MAANILRHLSIIAGGALGASGDGPEAVPESARVAAAAAAATFSAEKDLVAFSFLAPGIDRLLAEPASAAAARSACEEAASILAEAAGRCGAALRLCGKADGLPDALARSAVNPPAAAGRTLLWFVRYGGRDEIARAASRFFRAHPGATLPDDGLDEWLDTAGVPDPDLIVLAGGSFAAPDALLWQGSYAEFWHTATPWAAFTEGDVERAISHFHSRQRRFGG